MSPVKKLPTTNVEIIVNDYDGKSSIMEAWEINKIHFQFFK